MSDTNKGICPAYAGMILAKIYAELKGGDLSRVCGDDPECVHLLIGDLEFVPRMRG